MPKLIGGATSAPRASATRRQISCGISTSVESGECGPCCSVDPVGIRTASSPRRYSSTWRLLSSAMKTDGNPGGMLNVVLPASRSLQDRGRLALHEHVLDRQARDLDQGDRRVPRGEVLVQ